MKELHSVVEAEPLGEMQVKVVFDNGVSGIFDCSYLVKDPYWAKLGSPAFFRQVRAECGTLCWPEDIDVPPESVWEDVSRNAAQVISEKTA